MKFDQIVLEEKSCPNGCQLNDESVLIGRDRLYNLPGEFQVVKCKTCGLMRTNPRPTPETIGFYYPDNYAPYQNTQVSAQTASGRSIPLWRRLIRPLFEFQTKHLPSLAPGRMLEIGCASGAFLHKMAALGWDVEGLEFSQQAAELARSLGYTIHTGALETAPAPEKPYDLVVGWMVLEHLHDPILCLKKLRQWVHPGGWLALSVPNTASFEFQTFKDAWYALHLPNHLYHYTPQTVKLVLERGGWQLERVFHHRVITNLVASLGYTFQDKGYKNWLTQVLIDSATKYWQMNYLLYPLAYPLSLFGQTGRMTVWARRLDD